jgi:hypothetical protein
MVCHLKVQPCILVAIDEHKYEFMKHNLILPVHSRRVSNFMSSPPRFTKSVTRIAKPLDASTVVGLTIPKLDIKHRKSVSGVLTVD